jgi:hypothetical protein
LETRDSGVYHCVQGQVRRRKKQVSIRGLNKDHNHDLKGLFKAAATRASVQPGPFQDFYRSLANGIKPTMVRLTLARKIAAITLTLWKKGEKLRRPETEIANRLSVSGESPFDRCRFRTTVCNVTMPRSRGGTLAFWPKSHSPLVARLTVLFGRFGGVLMSKLLAIAIAMRVRKRLGVINAIYIAIVGWNLIMIVGMMLLGK